MNRTLLAVAALTVTVSLALLFKNEPESSGDNAATPAGASGPRATTPAAASASASAPAADLFPQQDWTAPVEASTPLNEKPAPASLPPLPFTLAGIWQEGEARVVFINDGPRVLALCDRCTTDGALHPGAQLSARYRLRAIHPDFLEFEHLPGNERQRLRIEP
jgi:hypothetical protein